VQQIDPELRQAIELHPSNDVARIAQDLSNKLGRNVPVSTVVRIRGTLKRSTDVNKAREQAAGSLGEKVDRIEAASTVLEKIFHDSALPLKDRIEASKELRQWTKLGMDAAGIQDAESDTIFVVEGDWNPFPTKP
jgi:hypothetical protein